MPKGHQRIPLISGVWGHSAGKAPPFGNAVLQSCVDGSVKGGVGGKVLLRLSWMPLFLVRGQGPCNGVRNGMSSWILLRQHWRSSFMTPMNSASVFGVIACNNRMPTRELGLSEARNFPAKL